ncbi:MAG: type III-B CRISPR module RAMP protein Cmr1 [Thermoleophilia bacterium]
MTAERVYTLTALTDLWTGSVRLDEQKGQLRERIVPDRLITTGLLGSIRWWFEVVVRGLDGHACDPTQDGNRCPDSRRKPSEPGHHCVVCELFGCTDWARKFRFDVLDADGKPQQDQITAGDNPSFRLRFTPLRSIEQEEWALLDLTLRLIAKYGAIGGKTVLKNRDYGRIAVDIPQGNVTRQVLEQYVKNPRWRSMRHEGFEWASVTHFWFVESHYLDSRQFNQVVRRNSWLRGSRGTSKKVFSFKNPESARRTFGFVQTKDRLGEMRRRLKEKAWGDLDDGEFVNGDEILRRLLGEGGRG